MVNQATEGGERLLRKKRSFQKREPMNTINFVQHTSVRHLGGFCMHSWTLIHLSQDAAVFSSKVNTLCSMSDAIEKDKKTLIKILLIFK